MGPPNFSITWLTITCISELRRSLASTVSSDFGISALVPAPASAACAGAGVGSTSSLTLRGTGAAAAAASEFTGLASAESDTPLSGAAAGDIADVAEAQEAGSGLHDVLAKC